MKHLLLLPLLFVCFAITAQPEPEQPGYIYLLDSGKVKLLERQKLLSKKNYIYFEGGSSSIQVVENKEIEMVARVMNNQQDPIASVRLYRIDTKTRKKRKLPRIKSKKPHKPKGSVFVGYHNGMPIYRDTTPSNQLKVPGTKNLDKTLGPSTVENQGLLLINYKQIDRIYFESTPHKTGSLKISLKELKPGSYAIKVMGDKLNWSLFDVVKEKKK